MNECPKEKLKLTTSLCIAGVGGVMGMLCDKRNPWRGALVGTATGAFIGYALPGLLGEDGDDVHFYGEDSPYYRTYQTESGL